MVQLRLRVVNCLPRFDAGRGGLERKRPLHGEGRQPVARSAPLGGQTNCLKAAGIEALSLSMRDTSAEHVASISRTGTHG